MGQFLRRWSVLFAVLCAVLIVLVATLHRTGAAFFASTSNDGNSFGSGSVKLADDDTGSALFTVGELYPGRTGSRCIRVTYTGTFDADVKLFVAPGDVGGSGLASALKLSITQGTGGSFADCAGFTAGPSLVDDRPLSEIAGYDSPANGLGTWSASTGASRTYRFSYALADDNAASGRNATVRFSWTATGP